MDLGLSRSGKPRPGRSARGFHGDGKQASTASPTTAKCPAFHPPLGAQGDDRGAGCEAEKGAWTTRSPSFSFR